jgi:hypothetical protein
MKKELNHQEKLELLRRGNFTIYYHDNDPGSWAVYDTFVNDDEIEDWEAFDAMHKLFEGTGYGSEGYCPEEVALLVEALGGKSESV